MTPSVFELNYMGRKGTFSQNSFFKIHLDNDAQHNIFFRTFKKKNVQVIVLEHQTPQQVLKAS